MDTLTHALSGALFARAITPAKLRPSDPPIWQRMTLCAVAAAFPDSDIVVNFFSSYYYLLHHRGATHSILLLPLWALFLAGLAALCFRRPEGWRTYAGISALGIAAHIVGDLITSYGTIIFAPLSNERFAWGTTFIIDLWFTGIILAGLIGGWIWKVSRAPAVAASVLLIAYVGAQAVWRSQAIEFGEQYARAQGINAAQVTVQPGAVLPLNWMVMVEKNGDYRYAFVNLKRADIATDPGPEGGFIARLDASFNPLSDAIWNRASLLGASTEDAPLVREAWMSPEMDFFRWFAQYPALLRVERDNPDNNLAAECVWFHDLRFTRPGNTFNPFRFGLCREKGREWTRYRANGDTGRERF
ncbi:MAG: metal-dependent hydrolase [Burkholderiales bacterium]